MAKIKQLIECVPNFSEGRDMNVINQITDEIRNSAGVRLLDVDPGEATNRTVVTFVGEPDAVMEAAFRAVRKASQLIDMRQHHGAHPRSGEYEAIPERINDPAEAPDFGARPFDEGVARTGCTNVGARDFLIAVNYNLNTTSTRRANAIAFDVREKGRPAREGNPITGKVKLDENGKKIMIPGTLKGTKGIGWYIEEYECNAAPRGL